MPALAEWDSFYVIVGSAAGALIGLQFVVMTLIAENPPKGVSEGSATFSTPTVVHFSVVLLLSALVRIPWETIVSAALAWGALGLCGLVYTAAVVRRMRSQSVYEPVFEDWLFHALLPLVSYLILGASALMAGPQTHEALLGVGTAALVLLFVGIHNAWDAVAYHVVVNLGGNKPKDAQAPKRSKR
ncbi:MAG TPA: hypothetical protein VH327_01060 [Gammaproteobacteria bacterium]|jgi:hypothetical protein|nr:hypothetical protein [Gammaproteobacteria bacterium]